MNNTIKMLKKQCYFEILWGESDNNHLEVLKQYIFLSNISKKREEHKEVSIYNEVINKKGEVLWERSWQKEF